VIAMFVAFLLMVIAVMLGEVGGELFYERPAPQNAQLRLMARLFGLLFGFLAIMLVAVR